jgi:putative ABC transport system ATP-binding protein
MSHCSSTWLIISSALRRTYQSVSSAERALGKQPNSIHFPPIEIRPGGLVAVVGLSGSGKSTFLNLLGGLDRPEQTAEATPSIELNIDGSPIDIVSTPAAYPRKQVGFIFQQGILLENLSVGMNVGLPSLIGGRTISNRQIEQLLGEFNLDPAIRIKRAWQLSGGEAQRVGFARAVAHDPVLLFLDEPTSNLDFANAERLMRWIQTWKAADLRRTVIWVTHDVDLVAKFADSILVLGANVDQSGTLKAIANPGVAANIRNWVQDPHTVPAFDEQRDLFRPAGANKSQPGSSGPGIAAASRNLPSSIGIGLRLAISEMCARRRQSSQTTVEQPLADWLASVEPGKGGAFAGWFSAAVRMFSDWPQLISMICAIVIAASVIATGTYGYIAYSNVLSDPRNCHVVVTGSIGGVADAGQGTRKALALDADLVAKDKNRLNWDADNRLVKPPIGFEYGPADCTSGEGVFGRRDFQPWELGFLGADAGNGDDPQTRCQGIKSTFRMMVTEPNEPLLQTIKFVDRAKSRHRTVADFFFDPEIFPGKEIFVTPNVIRTVQAYMLEHKPGTAALEKGLPSELCLMDVSVGQHEIFRVAGVIESLPAPRTASYDFLITDSSYQTMARGSKIPTLFTQVVFYFNPTKIPAIESFLIGNGLIYIRDSLDSLNRQISEYKLLVVVFLFFMVFVAQYIMITCISNVSIYLDSSGSSLAVLRSFGFDRSWLLGVVLCRQLLLFVIGAFFAAVL